MSRIASNVIIYFNGYNSKIKADLHKVGNCFIIDYSQHKFDFLAAADDKDIDYRYNSSKERCHLLESGIIVVLEHDLRKVEK